MVWPLKAEAGPDTMSLGWAFKDVPAAAKSSAMIANVLIFVFPFWVLQTRMGLLHKREEYGDPCELRRNMERLVEIEAVPAAALTEVDEGVHQSFS